MGTQVRLADFITMTGHAMCHFYGTSMMPMLRTRSDAIMLERCDPNNLKKYDIVAFKKHKYGHKYLVLHRILRKNRDGSYWIVGDNCYKGDTVTPDRIIGKLTAYTRDGKTFRLNDKFYKRYVHLWCAPWPLRFLVLRVRELFLRNQQAEQEGQIQ